VIKTTNCLLAPTAKELPLPDPAQACIRCGLCAEVCPASLLPQQLFWYAQAEDFDRLESHNLFDCIECGACSYVCPSSIPLVQYYRAAKGSIRQHLIEKEKSDRSRQRFEFRKERLAKEEAEKEAKRLARQKAAEEAKKQLADKQAAAPVPAQIVDPTKVAVPELSPDEQKAKLERLVAAAKNALEFAQKPLVSRDPKNKPITEEQLEKQAARIKQAELKLSEAENKLAEFLAQAPAQVATPTTSAAAPADDPVAAAIARAQAKMNLSPTDKLKADLESLQTRLQKAQEKVEAAKTEGSSTLDALQQGVEKLQQKIAQTTASLKELGIDVSAAPVVSEPEKSAAELAIEKAKTKAAALANMSDDEKRAEQRKSLEDRLQKARERLVKAEAENDANVEVFRSSVEKLEIKLKGM
jgi:electron transport complex protein RnfC